jgi:hypothetical protein
LDDIRSQYRATRPSLAYYKADGTELNSNARRNRSAWEEGDFHTRSALRIHVCLPKSASTTGIAGVPEPEYMPGVYLGEEDSIVVNLDQTNFFLLFDKMDKKLVNDLFHLLDLILPERFSLARE